jgi:hypothetical protein
MYGKTIDCSSPLQKFEGFPKKKRETNAIDIAKRRHLTDIRATSPNTPDFAVRSNCPWPGLYCNPGIGTSVIFDCVDALLELKGMKTIKLPYKIDGSGCQIQIYSMNRNTPKTSDTTISGQIEYDLKACADSTGQYVGMLENYRGNGYHWFAAAFCGAFQTGRGGNCWVGGK